MTANVPRLYERRGTREARHLSSEQPRASDKNQTQLSFVCSLVVSPQTHGRFMEKMHEIKNNHAFSQKREEIIIFLC